MEGEDRGHQRRETEREARAGNIVSTMPAMPRPDDHPKAQLRKVTAWRTWIEQVQQQVARDSELSNLTLEKIKDRMGLNNPDPAQAAKNARELLVAGMGDIGVSRRAAEAMRRQGVDPSNSAKLLVKEYVDAWASRGVETLIVRRVGGETLCVGLRDALRINIWLSGEPGVPSIPSDELDPDA